MTKLERDQLRWANLGLELAENGLKWGLKVKDTDDPATCSTELWNLRVARRVIESIVGKFNPKTRRWVKRRSPAAASGITKEK